VLLDEIEKAHPDVFNVLLQVLDDGVLTDSSRRRVDFKNTLIIMTSNLGGRQIIAGGKHLGFKQAEGGEAQFAAIKSTVQDELKRTFNPEFLNRIDDTVVFHALTRENMQAIVLILLQQVRDRLRSQDVTLDIDPAAIEFLVERGFDPSLGARPLKRAIQRWLEDPLAEHILRGKVKGGGTVRVERREDGLDFATRTDDSGSDIVPADAPAPASPGG
jgi:ATP-dependent Clp protease ATP-binding subunit ClpC